LLIAPRFGRGSEAILAPFMTGETVFDPFTGQPRQLNDLARRKTDLASLVCPPSASPSLRSEPGASTIAKGIGRVH
jgi:hypothetical protein